jgi:hypothetical protein
MAVGSDIRERSGVKAETAGALEVGNFCVQSEV